MIIYFIKNNLAKYLNKRMKHIPDLTLNITFLLLHLAMVLIQQVNNLQEGTRINKLELLFKRTHYNFLRKSLMIIYIQKQVVHLGLNKLNHNN